MAFSISDGQIAVLIRAATDSTSVPAPVALALSFLVPAAKDMIEQYAPGAPGEVMDTALVRLAGYLYDMGPESARLSNPLVNSGAAAILAQWRVHRAGVINPTTATTPVEPAGNIPEPPTAGTFILAADNGELEWLTFPKP